MSFKNYPIEHLENCFMLEAKAYDKERDRKRLVRISVANIGTKTRSRRCWNSPTHNVKEKSWTKQKRMVSKENIDLEVSSKKIIKALLPTPTPTYHVFLRDEVIKNLPETPF